MERANAIRVLSGAVIVFAAAAPADARFSGMVLFGDSLTDVGNVYNQTFGISPQSPPNFQGRFTNGPVWAETLALTLDLPVLAPSRQGGRNYAYGGTKTGGGSTFFFPFSFPNIGSQINQYLGNNTPSAEQLFVVWGGGNDFIDGQTNPSVPVNNISNHLTALANAGARQFLVPNLPPLGQIPRYRGTASEATLDNRSAQFNNLLATTLDALESSLDVQIWNLDVGGLFQDLLSNPSAYGFTNVTSPALVGGTPVPNADEYLFWDEIHPTRVGHALLGSLAGELLNTHTWVTTAPGGSWSGAANWDPAGVPDSDWIAHVVNNNVAGPQAVAVDQNSTVQHLLVRGDTGRMTLIIQSISKLSAGSVLIAQDGEINLQGGTLSSAQVTVASGGTLGSTGWVEGNVNNAGTLSPGDPGTVLRIGGDYTQTASGVLAIDLSPGGTSDRLEVSGAVSLDGSLAVRLTDGFIALPGNESLVMTFGSRSGDLDVVNATGFAGLSFNKTYTSFDLTLTADALGGDANLDGVVNLQDFNILASNFGASNQNWLGADFNFDGIVNLADFNILAANFGQSAAGSGVTAGDWANLATAIPEPAGMFSTAGLLFLLRRSRRRLHLRFS